MVGINDEAVNAFDDRVSHGIEALRGVHLKVDENFYLKEKNLSIVDVCRP